MGWVVARAALVVGGALVLAGCGLADSHAPVPEFMRAKTLDPPPPELPPDVAQLVREGLNSIFVAASNPQNVRVSSPRHEFRGLGYTACVKAELTSAIGKPLGEETYRIAIQGALIVDRRRAEPEDGCAAEDFRPV